MAKAAAGCRSVSRGIGAWILIVRDGCAGHKVSLVDNGAIGGGETVVYCLDDE